MAKVIWYYVAAMWSGMFPSYHERKQREMARARVAYLRRFGRGR